ncbi:hypothetical protein [Shouchella shacheensis]|nr:hypothetical protein [Shouchella shacheensis]
MEIKSLHHLINEYQEIGDDQLLADHLFTFVCKKNKDVESFLLS